MTDQLTTDQPKTRAPMNENPTPTLNPPPPTPAPIPEIKLGSGVPIPSKNGGSSPPRTSQPAPTPYGSGGQASRENRAAYIPGNGGGIRRVRVKLYPTNDSAMDMKHMRDVVKLLRSADGNDRFLLVVPHESSWVEIDFPNYYTNVEQVTPILLDLVAEWGQVELA
jgi:hypothetical protein